MNLAAIFISMLALLFAVASFYWMNWRTGNLHVSRPRSYSALGSKEGRLILYLPFVFFNDGPTPIVVQNLRVEFQEEMQLQPLTFTDVVKEVDPRNNQGSRSVATQFPVRGREAVLMVCEFQREPGNMLFEAKSYPLELQARLGTCPEWQTICKFALNVSERDIPTINSQFTMHDNDEHDHICLTRPSTHERDLR